MTIQKLRDFFPALSRWHYLNYAATGILPTPSIQLLKDLAEDASEPYFTHREKWLGLQDSARMSAAKLIGASSDEIAFTAATSGALSIVANAVLWKEGDRVLYPADEFPSNRFVWDNLIHKGVKAEAIEPEKGVSFADQLAKLDLTGVRLVSFSLVSYWDGRVQDVAKVVRLCHERGILVSVDAIQGLGAVPFDVKEAGCDFVSSGGHKWLCGPLGIGFLYVRKPLIEELFVPNVGWASMKNPREFEAKTFVFDESARRFEAGGRDIWGIAALGRSIDTLASVGWSSVYAKIAEWNRYLRKEITALGYQPLYEGDASSGIVGFHLKSMNDVERLKQNCEKANVILVQRGDYVRVSAHAFAQKGDLEAFLGALANE
jgi:selenocysteine lyase/cysteine desulfurase